MPKVWRFPPYDEAVVRRLAGDLKKPVLIAQVLAARGFQNGEQANEFLSARLVDLHEPELLPGVPAATDRIVAAVEAGRRITIYGDYDVDGVTSTSILWHCLNLLGATVDYYIPHRLDEGYGLNRDAIRQLHEEDSTRLVITVDCGITSVDDAILAREIGLELIITDHHNMAESIPDAVVVVHPRLPGTNYPFGDLCGAGVAFKLAWAICKRMGDGKKASPRMRNFLMSAVGLAAIGTVADVVPLVGENRIIVRYGLASLLERSSPGLKALMKIAGSGSQKTLTAEDIGFGIGPRINAAGRLGQARLAVELLTTDDQERVVALVEYLEQLNGNRKTVERRILRQAKELVAENPHWLEQKALVLAHADWHPGVIGIVANRVAEHFERPTILISLHRPDEPGQGSGRSFAGFDLHSGLVHCREYLKTFGGHKVAAGLKIERDQIDAFRIDLCEYVAANHEVKSSDVELAIDAEVRLADLTHKAVTGLEELGPFGAANPRPVFASTKVELAGKPKKMGEGERHLDLRVRHYGTTLRAVAFGKGEWADEIAAVDGPISICFAPVINRFRGQENVEMHLIDWQPVSGS
ncbi:MAG: single-stranded-DNA-specific exonuclease RecJ [Planctomycetota bacterium]|nr:single-stranded-DNA-specific exonuclease RecJ [Planctomycetota bacterium]MDA1161776.1 single-stranded-DNA-specific exonuclease RecJ [Planctomycetota bacterium]